MKFFRIVNTFLYLPLAFAQSNAVSDLRAHLVANNEYTLKISGIHATTDLLGRPAEIRIVNGTLTRPPFLHGKQDIILNAGQLVQVSKVETGRDAKADLLRITIVASGLTVPIVFALPTGTLGTMNETQLEGVVTLILAPTQGSSTTSAVKGNRPGPVVITPKSPSLGPIGGETFNPATAPNLSIATVAALAERCKANGSRTVIKLPGLEAGMNTFVARENVILNSTIQPAPPGFFRGMRSTRLNPGEPVQIIDVRAMDDGEHDILHFLLQTDFPTFGNVAFVFPKGQLATLSSSDLERLVTPYFGLPGRPVPFDTIRSAASKSSTSTFVLEGIGLGMTLDDARLAAKAAGSLKGPLKQGPSTYNLRTRDLVFQLELNQDKEVTQYNVSAVNPRHLTETETTGPLFNMLVKAFGPRSGWGKQVVYDLGEGTGAYAIVSDLSHF